MYSDKCLMMLLGRWYRAVVIAAAVFGSVCAGYLQATTYYVDNAATSDSGTGSSTSPKKYIKSGIVLMAAGDTLIIRDGVYTGINNMLCSSTNWEWNGVPNGNASAYTTVKGEHYLGAVLDGQNTYNPVFLTGCQYLRIENLHVRNSGSTNGGSNFAFLESNHVKVIRCASEETYYFHFRFRHCKYSLSEECCSWGRGAYSIIFSGESNDYTLSQYNIARRFVSRRDAHYWAPGGNHWASFVSYWGDNTYFQNCISLDGHYVYVGEPNPPTIEKPVFFTANGSTNYYADGCVSTNDEGMVGMFESGASPVTLRNNSCILASSNADNGVLTYGNAVTLQNNIFARAIADGDWTGCGIGQVTNTIQSAQNNIIFGCTYGLESVTGSHSNNVLYNNTQNYQYTSAGSGDVTNRDPSTNGLRYPVRIEAGSFLATAGAGGGQCGPTIQKRIGVAETLYGDAGWNTVTADNLWPFPNEDAIRTQMMTYNLHGASGARGFCAAGMTLTKYIWQYLGNTIPSDIYAAGGPTSPTASIAANPASGMAPLAVAFTGSGSGGSGTISSYSWNFGDGTTSTQQNPSHTYPNPGNYTATLTVTDSKGATGSASVGVNVTTVYTLGGSVKDKRGGGIAAVSCTLSGDATGSAVTDANGAYQFTGLVRGGSFVVTPAKTSWNFSPVSVSTISLSGNLANQNFTGAPLYYIKGYVNNSSGAGVSGVTMGLSGNATRSLISAVDDSYAFNDLPSGSNYTVTPSKTGYVFTPVSASTGSLSANMDNVNFSAATPVTYYMGGYVRDAAGNAISGVTIVVTGDIILSVLTGANGSFQVTGLPAGGNYTLTASRAGYSFTPGSLTKTGLNGNLDNQNFTGTQLFHIAGYVKNNLGAAVSGATLAISGALTAAVTTGSNGSYRFDGLHKGGNYTVTPTKNNWKFSPASFNIPALSGDLDDQNFTGAQRFYIRGIIRSNAGTAIGSALVVLSGAQSQSVTTDHNGMYQFTDLPENSTYTVTSAKNGYLFSPSMHNTNRLTAAIDDWDFTGIYLQTLPQGQLKIIGPAAGKGAVNPARGETAKILFKGNMAGDFELRIFTLTGDLVYQDRKENVSEGIFEWAPKDVASGIYIADIRGPGINARNKIAVIR